MSRPNEVISGRYRLVEKIAAGGMGSVWQAWDERLHRRVALKQLHPNPGVEGDAARLASDRAMREARITARLHHAHAVPVYDVVDHEGYPCLIMQYLPSQSLHAMVAERGTLPVAQVSRIGAEVASALAAAHQVGIVHRDVKPGNILVEPDGSAKITDFGISHALGDVALTSTGIVTGTPAYLAPEVARGQESTVATDVFSLGSTLYAAVEGTPPFGTSDNPMATLHRVATGQITPPGRAGVLGPVLLRMLAAAPEDRPSMDHARRSLAAVAADPDAPSSTQRLASPPPVPPTRTMSLPAVAPAAASAPPGFARPGSARPESARPPAGPHSSPTGPSRRPVGPPPDNRRSRLRAGLVGLLLLVLLAALAIVLVTQLTGSGSGGGSGGASSPAVARPTRSSVKASRTATSSSTASNPPSTKPSSSASSSTPSPTSGTPTAAQLSAAVTDYYALLPGDTTSAYQRLTPAYQSGHAGGRGGYDQFWNGFSSVSVTGVVANPPDTVTATINYVSKDGSRRSENTTFGLVRQGGILKIDSTTVN